jgi:hypothetical protein
MSSKAGSKEPTHRLCNVCHGPISFRQRANGKWEPCELDGSDHWDICSRRKWEQSGRSKAGKPPSFTLPNADITHVWNNPDIPPWDDSLGTFRNFTPEETTAGVVCQPLGLTGNPNAR